MSKRATAGYYGPAPIERFGSWRLLPLRLEALAAGLVLRHFVSLVDLRPIDRHGTEILQKGSGHLRFAPWLPQHLPSGFTVHSAVPSTTIGDALIVTLRADDGRRSFEIAQRQKWLDIADELSTARLPFTRVPVNRRAVFAVHGRHGGEPIDHSFWLTRQAVMFEVGDLVIELRETRGRGAGLARLVRFAVATLKSWGCEGWRTIVTAQPNKEAHE